MLTRRKGRNRWKLLLTAAIFVVGLLLWLEWLGSEQPQKLTEIPVAKPDSKAKTGTKIDK